MPLSKEIQDTFPKGITMPSEVATLLDYIEENQPAYFQIDIQFSPVNKDAVTYYFNNPDPLKYLGVLGTTADGSILAIWKNAGKQYFIHLGSEGNDWLILASNPIDFIKVISIGYNSFEKGVVINPPAKSVIDKSFRDWVRETYAIEIPESGKDIVDLKSIEFSDWVRSKMNFG